MSKNINANQRPKSVPLVGELRVTVVNASEPKPDPVEESARVDKRHETLAIEAAVEMMRDQRAQMKTLTDACADMSRATAEYVRKAAAARFPEPPAKPKAPPPVSTHLRRFTHAIGEKVTATTALLTDEQRTRVAAILPAFTVATLSNDAEVVALVVRWMDLSPEDIARELVVSLDAFERRFAQ
jgi:hypothetical protein